MSTPLKSELNKLFQKAARIPLELTSVLNNIDLSKNANLHNALRKHLLELVRFETGSASEQIQLNLLKPELRTEGINLELNELAPKALLRLFTDTRLKNLWLLSGADANAWKKIDNSSSESNSNTLFGLFSLMVEQDEELLNRFYESVNEVVYSLDQDKQNLNPLPKICAA